MYHTKPLSVNSAPFYQGSCKKTHRADSRYLSPNVVVWNTTQGAVTDSTGLFEISGISPGSYRLQSSFLGYKPFVTAEFRLANKDIFFPIELEEASQNLQEVSVVASPFRKTAESPLGLRVIGFKEIEKSGRKPGYLPGSTNLSRSSVHGSVS